MTNVSIEIPEKAIEELPKQIYWVGMYSDLPSFPDIADLRSRCMLLYEQRQPLRCFLEAIVNVENRIWILDPFFGSCSINEVPTEFTESLEITEAREIRFISKGYTHIPEYVKALRDKRRKRIPGKKHGIDWLSNPDPLKIQILHDRFAILDNELWHFGHTVGGYETSLTAVSRGWSAIATGAADFYQKLWRDLGGGQW